jgi:hypothetical protein
MPDSLLLHHGDHGLDRVRDKGCVLSVTLAADAKAADDGIDSAEALFEIIEPERTPANSHVCRVLECQL